MDKTDKISEISVYPEKFHKVIRADERFEDVPKLLPLLEYDIVIPVFDEKFERINRFYKSLSDECIKYAENELSQKSAAEYIASPDTKKRYRYKRFIYSVAYILKNWTDKSMEILILIRVSVGNETRFSREISHIWDTESILMLPPKKGKKLRLKLKLHKKKKAISQE